MGLKWLAVIVTFLLGCTSQRQEANPTIVGGTVITAADTDAASAQLRSSTVALVFSKNIAYCSGVLIGPNHVLTAAHCIPPAWVIPSPSDYEISFGVDVYKNTQKRYFKRAIAHPSFVDPPDYYGNKELFDIAVIEFEGALPEGFAPLPILKADVSVRPVQVLISGFGFDSAEDADRDGSSVGVLRKAVVDYAANITSRKLHLLGRVGLETGSCNADSGGPAFVASAGVLNILGVTSGGNCVGTSVYTNVIAYRDWIRKVTGLDIDRNTVTAAADASGSYVVNFDFPKAQSSTGNQSASSTSGAGVGNGVSGAAGSAGSGGGGSSSGIAGSVPGSAGVQQVPVVQPPSPPQVAAPASRSSSSDLNVFQKYSQGLIGKSIVVHSGNKETCLSFSTLEDCRVRERNKSQPSGEIVDAKCQLGGASETQVQISCGNAPSGVCAGAFHVLNQLNLDKEMTGAEPDRFVTLFAEDFSAKWTVHSKAYCEMLFR